MYSVSKKICGAVTRLFVVKHLTITKGLTVLLVFCLMSLAGLSYYVSTGTFNTVNRSPPQPTITCLSRLSDHPQGGPVHINDHSAMPQLRIVSKVLVLVETPFTRMGTEIIAILEANRMRYKVEIAQKSLPNLTHMDKGRYGVVIFERLESYLNMDNWNRQLLDKYCREYSVGIIAFAHPDERLFNAQVKDFPLFVHSKLSMRDYMIKDESPVLRVTRAGEMAHGVMPGDNWTVFVPNHTTYEPIACAKLNPTTPILLDEIKDPSDILHTTIIRDRGEFDGIQRVIFGNGFQFWLHRLLFLDVLSFLSHGKLSIPLARYMLIDVDDIFVGKQGTRLKVTDVEAMVESQRRLQESIEGFHFNLGFSGKYFHHGTAEENLGDDALLENNQEFWWFPHMWRHYQPHKFDNVSFLESEMLRNYMFSKKNNLVVNTSYAVAPHHSGVYPVHEPLYEAWRKVWGVRVTSTEEYPHLRPARHRRGFMYRGIKVLPRQTCGLFTHTIFMDKFPGGRAKLDQSIRGGELFLTILFNPVSVFMTHMSNYGNDRLALYTFESVSKFIKCWTNLRLITLEPNKLANVYFDMYPDEVDPIWRNPCNDKRHLDIWAQRKSCKKLPEFLVIGPQKTGTTALYMFLGMHPNIRSNKNSATTFEEVQFFNGKNYYKGLDWYMDMFPERVHGSGVHMFEKSANYFDSEKSPERAFALLPTAKLICIIIDPAKRAYSWYQHQKAHNDEVALSHSFYEVVTAGEGASHSLRELRNRCLNPGMYAQNLQRWLDYFKDEQMLIIDGELLRINPIAIMDEVQKFLQIDPYIDYSTKLRYNQKKGFFCQVTESKHPLCLGSGKGRNYPEMDAHSELYLHQFYRKHNIALSKLLNSMGRVVPQWLEQTLMDTR